jgi:hypothetical protein
MVEFMVFDIGRNSQARPGKELVWGDYGHFGLTLGYISTPRLLAPVRFPPGWLGLDTNPISTGSTPM